ncbi:D-TA family PLP-dependent enzyme [Prolixibacter denitrificans]|uniref:D-serine deaminase-like pyridoxal phosphate-dependent protein n=1 Tax=Prolixibacter denitrificans TaxID=1541063 RepID=A0A2P8C6Z1_9BACT|nr:D-TA family PLP-dependent enzyme [Prolixibacter denitrificans]PSK80739.1 D-serine deaminase-like pyridoxal phosphate-dependent protein [Prolixibacter denitrificans]GET22462.1 threonine aldolase [Prolixibacter denitrificans]
MWYSVTNESSVFTPSVLLYPDRIEENIRRMIVMAGDVKRLRPHVKTHKIAEIIQLQVQMGIRKFKCATLSEVKMVAENGGEDILLAYPLLGPAINWFLEFTNRFPNITFAVTIDSLAAAHMLDTAASQKGQTVRVFIDLDTGMHRTGIIPGLAEIIVDFIHGSKNLRFAGFHFYDGHVHEIDLAKRKAHIDRDFESVAHLVKNIKEKGIDVEEIACGGTPTFPIHVQYPERTLCPGTPILWDAGYTETIPDLDFLPAAVIAGRVISKPHGNVCFDLGYKAFASEMPHPRLQFLDFEPGEVVNHSEEHLVVAPDREEDFEIGELVYALPKHICPTMALHEKVYVVTNHQVTGTWDVTARKRIY